MGLTARVHHKDLLDTIGWMAKRAAAPFSGDPLPWSGVLLEATEDGHLTVTVRDYDGHARTTLTAAVHHPGRVLVSARLLDRIARELPAGSTVTLAEDTGRLTITLDRGRFSLPTMPVEDYPAVADLPAVAGQVEPDAWADTVRQVAYAAAGDKAGLPALTGIHLEFGEQLTLVATDRYRLAAVSLPWQPALPANAASAGAGGGDDAGGLATALLPVRALVDTLKPLVGGQPITLHHEAAAPVLGLSVPRRQVSARLIAEPFPGSWRRVVPAEPVGQVTVPAAEFDAMLRRAVAITDAKFPTVRLTLSANGLSVQDVHADPTGGHGEETLAVDWPHAEFSIRASAAYLRDALAAVDSEHVVVDVTDHNRPVVLRPAPTQAASRTAGTRLHLVTPVRALETAPARAA